MESDVKGWAKKLGVSESVIRDRWFKGSYPGVDKIIKLADDYDIDLNVFLVGKEKNATAQSEELKNLCLDLKEILETADEVSIAALKMNMAMIKGAVKDRLEAKKDKQEKIQLEKRVKVLEKKVKEHDKQKPHGCAEAPGDYLPTAEKET